MVPFIHSTSNFTFRSAHVIALVPRSWDLESRRACLRAESTQHLCKSIVMENTKLAEPLPGLSKYYCVIVQVSLLRSLLAVLVLLYVIYTDTAACFHEPTDWRNNVVTGLRRRCRTSENIILFIQMSSWLQYVARLHAEKLKRHLYQAHKAAGGALGTKAFKMRLCPEEVSNGLTGFEHNAVSPIGIAFHAHSVVKQVHKLRHAGAAPDTSRLNSAFCVCTPALRPLVRIG